MRPKNPLAFLEELAGAFHGSVGAANLFIAYYNWRKGHSGRALLHLAIAGFEGKCFHEHYEGVKRATRSD